MAWHLLGLLIATERVLAGSFGVADHRGDGLSVSPGGQGGALWSTNHGAPVRLSTQDKSVNCSLPLLSATPTLEPQHS